MRKLKNHLIGVDRGSVLVFSDLDDNGEMWTGTGPRLRRVEVRFHGAFRSIPVVQVVTEMLDKDKGTNHRTDISAEDITETGFVAAFRTWGDTRIARVRAGWLAIGELADADEWQGID